MISTKLSTLVIEMDANTETLKGNCLTLNKHNKLIVVVTVKQVHSHNEPTIKYMMLEQGIY